MSAGNQPNAGSLNQFAGSLVIAIRDDMQRILNFNDYLTAAGGSTFLQGLGFSSGDAAVMISTIANLANLANAYQGNAVITSAFNFKANSNLLWGGQ